MRDDALHDQRERRPAHSVSESVSRRALLRRGLAASALLAGASGWGALAASAPLARAADTPGIAPPAPAPAGGNVSAPDLEAIVRSKVQDFLASRPTPGLAVALHTPGQDRFFSFGYADREAQQPVTEEILFNLGSIEKVFTATLLASQIVDRTSPAPKQLSDPVTAYLPSQLGDSPLRQVTLQELATHTSSMPRTAPGVRAPGQQLWNDERPAPDLLNWWHTWTPPADHPPGTHYEYSNAGFVTLGFAVVGQPGPPAAAGYPALLARTITEPLRMPVTATHVPTGQVLAKGYIRNGDAARPIRQEPTNIYTSARDMLTFVKAQLGLLDATIPPTLAQAIALTHNAYFSPQGDQRLPFDMGLAWEIRNRRPDSPTILTKNGATSRAGHTCAIALMPDRQMGIALLTNVFGNGSDPTGLGIDILRTLAAQGDSG